MGSRNNLSIQVLGQCKICLVVKNKFSLSSESLEVWRVKVTQRWCYKLYAEAVHHRVGYRRQ